MGRIQGSVERGGLDGNPCTATAAAVDVQGVTKRYSNGVVAVSDVSVRVAENVFLCLLGPSGSGKTTLLRLMGGLEIPDAGRVLIDGQDVTTIPATRRRTNMVFQHHALFPHLNVFDNVAFGPRMRGAARDSIAHRVREVLSRVQLSGHEDRRINQLSGGQRQRVAIARAIINDPAVLLLDEPLASLDMRLRGELQIELRRLQRALGSPFISVTHDQDEAMALADQIAVINEGRIEQIGTPHEIFYRPASLFVAQFIGRTNTLRGVLCVRFGAAEYAVDLGGVVVPCSAPTGVTIGRAVAVVIRQEFISVVRARSTSLATQARVTAKVLDRSLLGVRVRYTLRLTDTVTIVAEPVFDPARGEETPHVGDEVLIGWKLSDAPVFPTS